MDGILNVLKPPGMTSYDVVAFCRKILKTKKIGHGGTLDPAASGVLPIFVGKATKSIQFFEDTDKEYIAEIKLGVATDTGDAEGRILSIKKVKVNVDEIKKVFAKFIGKVQQIPPMYSAVHFKGKRLYELAREGIVVERKPRIIEIKSLELLRLKDHRVSFKIICSKGTYIRALCEDMGQKLGCGAYLSCLVRTRSGPFSIEDSCTIEDVMQRGFNNDIGEILIPIEKGLSHLPKVEIPLQMKTDFINRQPIYWNSIPIDEGFVRIYWNKTFIGVGKIVSRNDEHSFLKMVKYFVQD